jgi:hypothetical protein
MGSMSGGVSEKAKRGVQTSPNGLVTNIPPTMVNNQFGMIGLLTFIRAAESDPNLGEDFLLLKFCLVFFIKNYVAYSVASNGSRFDGTWSESEFNGKSLSELWRTVLRFASEATRYRLSSSIGVFNQCPNSRQTFTDETETVQG